jgi:hypothetical protein
LQGDDRQAALRELAMRMPDVVAGTQMQIQQAREEGQESILAARQGVQDVAAAQATATQERLADLQKMRMENRAGAIDDQRDLRNSILKEVILGQIDGGGEGGMTPTQRRAAGEERDKAEFWAKQLFSGAREAKAEDWGEPPEWDEKIWNGLVMGVMDKGGTSVEEAQRAIARIRGHVPQPQSVTDQLQSGQLPGFGPQDRRPQKPQQAAPPQQGGGGPDLRQILGLLAQAQKPGFTMEDLLRLAGQR